MSSLQTTTDPTREEVADLERRVSDRERELALVKTDLQQLQFRYLAELGSLYAELNALDEELAGLEIKAGLRVPDEADDPESEAVDSGSAGCAPASEPSPALKAMFRNIARAVHPDSAPAHVDERTRYRRHSLMAEANRAYAERDEDRLRLILRAWKLDEDAASCSNPAAERTRLQRRAAALTERLAELDAAFADLQSSAIARLKTRIDEARAQGWDLFAEMVRQIKREIAGARVKIARLRRRT